MVSNFTIEKNLNYENYASKNPWVDDELTGIIDMMEGYSHHTFQTWIEFVKINQPKPDSRNNHIVIM